MKHYTTIEQSKKLLELGLNPETADMYYFLDPTPLGNIYIPSLMLIEKYLKSRMFEYDKGDIPCWSIGCLMSLMPIINIGNQTYKWIFDIISLKYIETTNGEVLYNITCRGIFEKIYSMVVWLLENNYIEK